MNYESQHVQKMKDKSQNLEPTKLCLYISM